MTTSAHIRRQFIDFFVQKHGHTFVPSSPVVPLDDPTLLFTNAGMNQFKPIFLGVEKRAYHRAANTQKSIRAGGKHNDLDDVGRSRRHHTFFEMLGNWSFGDYFKRGAIEMAWELLTRVWKIDPGRLHVTCFQGDEKNGIPRDTEAADLWKQVAGLPDGHIHYFGADNFWEMGETGPCGPCTEIYVDRTPDKTGGPQVNGTDPRVMEIWNLVFIQYNRDGSGKLTTLPAQHVDTGMGLERICQVLQDKQDNYATDLFSPLFHALTKLTGIEYKGKFPRTNAADPEAEAADPQLRHDIAFRVIADHVRCLTFALTDGAVPSNLGRGYVLRRILRRAVRFGRQTLGLREPFLHTLVPVVVESMVEAFPELGKDPKKVAEIINDEELSFGRTIDRGIDLFEEAANRAKENSERTLVISGKDAFDLHTTYGFPIDLTQVMAAERGMTVDMEDYARRLKRHQELSGAGGQGVGGQLADLPPGILAELEKRGATPTDDHPKYHHDPIHAKVLAIWDGVELRDEAPLTLHTIDSDPDAPASRVAVILDRTPFYAEMGGQAGDVGELKTASLSRFAVEETRAVGGYVLHIGQLENGRLHAGNTVTAAVNFVRRRTEQNHTSTHLANWALREVLGDGIQQKGSLVDPEKLRFDFSHGKPMADDELARVESLVSASIEKKLPVYAEEAPQEQALKINGLRAVFGEKYPPMVRVVSIGAPVKDLLADPQNEKWRQFSVEFCGGTHLGNSNEAGGFVVTADESVSKGVRRIVGLTGDAATEATGHAKALDAQVAQAKQSPDAELPAAIASLQKAIGAGVLPLRAKRRGQAAVAELQARHKTFEKTSRSAGGSGSANGDATAAAGKLLESAVALGPGRLVVGEIPGAANDQLMAAVDSLKKKTGSYGILLASAEPGKVNFIAAVSDDLIAKGLKAGDWVREAATAAGGKGGGRPQLAQAGGKDPQKLGEALEKARAFAQKVVEG
jgi:alanyl-tRNA synthetase